MKAEEKANEIANAIKQQALMYRLDRMNIVFRIKEAILAGEQCAEIADQYKHEVDNVGQQIAEAIRSLED